MSFLDDYIDYTKEQESPTSFHLWTAITLVGVALGRKCYLDKRFYKLYPNLFTILVAGAAKCRKSTAISLGDVPIGVNLIKPLSIATIVNGKITPEGFLDVIDKAQPAIGISPLPILVHSSELSVFLTKQASGEPLIHILTDLFDCPSAWSNATKNKGTNNLRDVFLSIIAATTPIGLAKGIPASALHEGFASRVIFIYEEEPSVFNDLVSDATPPAPLNPAGLLVTLQAINALTGQFTLSTSAKFWYKHWYQEFMKTDAPDARLEGMYGRKHDHLLRVGMIFAGAEQSTIIEDHHLDAGLMALDAVEAKAPLAFTHLGGDELSDQTTKARVLLRRVLRLSHSELLKRMQPCSAEQFRKVMDTLLQEGSVRIFQGNQTLYEWYTVSSLGLDNAGSGSLGDLQKPESSDDSGSKKA